MKNMTKKWCYSTDDECCTGQFATKAEAHDAAQTAIDDESYFADGGIVKNYWIARCVHPLDMIRQDIGDDVPIDMAPEREIELGKLIIDFVRTHASVQQWGVKDTGKHQYIIGSKFE